MENWKPKQPEKILQGDIFAQSLEDVCAKYEKRLLGEFTGCDIPHTRKLLSQAYPDALAHAKNILEGKE